MSLADHPGLTAIPTKEGRTQWVLLTARSASVRAGTIVKKAHEAIWRIRRLKGRILIEIQPPGHDGSWLSLYLLESASGAVGIAANIDLIMASALSVPRWMLHNDTFLIIGLSTWNPLLTQGLRGEWPDGAQLEWATMPGDSKPHWLVGLAVPKRPWSDFANPKADLWKVVQPLTGPGPLHSVLNLCFALFNEENEGAKLSGWAKAGLRSLLLAGKIVLDHEQEEAKEHLKGLLLGRVTSSDSSYTPAKTSLIKPSVFRVFEER